MNDQTVTIGGWCERGDGKIQYFYWEHGRIVGGSVVDSWSYTKTILWCLDCDFEGVTESTRRGRATDSNAICPKCGSNNTIDEL